MDNQNGAHIIRSLQQRWLAAVLLADLLLAAGIAAALSILLYKTMGVTAWLFIPFFLGALGILFIVRKPWRINQQQVSRLLNQDCPQLEESCDLLLQPYDALNLLQQWQFKKTEAALLSMPKPQALRKKIWRAVIILAVFAGLCVLLTRLPLVTRIPAAGQKPAVAAAVQKPVPETLLPQVSEVQVVINPPAYTTNPPRTQQTFNLVAEEGALLTWKVTTSLPVKQVQFIFNDSIALSLVPEKNKENQWQAVKRVENPGFYQVKINDQLSELYKIEVIKDQAPVIHIQTPKQYTTIEYGEPEKVQAGVELSDDYGLRDAFITATIANGSGEAVKFKEQKLPFPAFAAGGRKYALQKQLQLAEMGMQPGDELYFYVSATDNHNQESRSDVYIVTLQDTAQLMSLEGLTLGLNIKPEFFRSERQIILETEQLIRDRSKIGDAAFKDKSNDLGIDQKLLRLRYGKFLGEENDPGAPGSAAGDQKELADPLNFGNSAVVLDKFTDKHDNAEDATFFEPELKKQLKATLTEMWNAEMPLRTIHPQEALPYEYKALRLLKDLQQKSRAYVAKTSFKSANLNTDKRLTGDLSKISQPLTSKDFSGNNTASQSMRSALGILEGWAPGDNNRAGLAASLQQAALELNKNAAAEPAIYLAAAQAMRKVMAAMQDNKNPAPADLRDAENGLQQLLTFPSPLPAAEQRNAGLQLSSAYFMHVNRRPLKP